MASNSSSEPGGPAPGAESGAGSETAAAETLSAAVLKFRSCRWRRPPEDGPECCSHRDVLPLAGTTDFNPEAWCPDCQYYKARRAPRRRERQEFW